MGRPDPASRAFDEATDDRAARPLDARLLRPLFLDLVARPPFASERERWLGATVGELLEDLVAGREFWEEWLEAQLYFFLLVENFRPESASVRSLPEELEGQRLGVRDAIQRIALCPNFDRRNPGADTFVTVVMEQLLGIDVKKASRELEIGKRVYDGHEGRFLGEAGRSQSDVIRIAMEDERFLTRFVSREYERLVRVEPEGRERKGWIRTLERDPFAYPALYREWLLSERYAARLTGRYDASNRVFLRALFVDLHDRLPGDTEIRQLRVALDALGDAGPLRSTLIKLMLDSGQVPLPERDSLGDRRAWVAGLFSRLLARDATDAELDAFTEALRDPACRVETVYYAILSDPEYATY